MVAYMSFELLWKATHAYCSKCVRFFSAYNGSIFYGRTKNREILAFELFVCSCVAVFGISCLLVVVYGGLEEGQ